MSNQTRNAKLRSTSRAPLMECVTKDIPLGRLGEPDDIALIVSFLASPNSGWINGQVIKVNGGRNYSTHSQDRVGNLRQLPSGSW
jgi:NAD(P)-dependent dehydrogenase (short-subunit alcohol dehydrogenase family)